MDEKKKRGRPKKKEPEVSSVENEQSKTINMSSINLTFIPLLFASEEFILTAKSLLKKKYQKHNTITAIPSSRKISSGTMLKISPIK